MKLFKMPESNLRIIGTRSVSKRGGSLQVTIPETAAQFLELEKGDRLTFIIDKKRNCVIVGKPDAESMEVMFSAFGKASLELSISKELAEKMLKKKQD
jgi:antitoxin component of MazEF toxin-antitoxin module